MSSQQDATNNPPDRDSSAHNSQQSFLFVNSSSTPAVPDAKQYKGRRDVRRFVMQKARRARPWSTSKQPYGRPDSRRVSIQSEEDASPPTVAHDAEGGADTDMVVRESGSNSADRPRCQSCADGMPLQDHTLCSRCWQQYSRAVQTRDSIADGRFDPFNTLPPSADVQSSDPGLWEQFCLMASSNPIPIDICGQSNVMWSVWTAPALKHPAFLHSLLCAAAVHRYALNKASYLSVAYHKSRAIAEINSSLSDPAASLSDENIGAVFTLLCIEQTIYVPKPNERHASGSNDAVDQVMVHLNGLRRMVDLRGGLGHLQSNICLESFILRHSILNSITSFDAPYLLPYDNDGNLRTYLEPSGPNHRLRSKVPGFLQRLNVDHCLSQIVIDSDDFIHQLNEWYANPYSAFRAINLQNQSSVLQYRLLQWLQDTNSSRHLPMDTTICLAFIISLVIVTDNFQSAVHHPLHYEAVPQLMDVLRYTEANDWAEAPQLIVWILTICSICAMGSSKSHCLTRRTAMIFDVFQIKSFDTLYNHLLECSWVPFKLDDRLQEFWAYFMNPAQYIGNDNEIENDANDLMQYENHAQFLPYQFFLPPRMAPMQEFWYPEAIKEM